ncbi:MAG: hypothetical protein ACJ77K_10700 [Bacteroidia bacterium]
MKERVTYNKAFGIFLIAGSVFILAVSFMIGFSINTITGAILLLVGILYLNGAAVIYNKEELELKNLYGSTMKRYNFHTDKVEIRDGAIYANGSKVRIGSMFLNRGELDRLHEFIEKKDYQN